MDTIFIRKISKVDNSLKMLVEFQFLSSAHHPMMIYICNKFHANGIRVMEQTRKVNGWTEDGWTDGGHDITQPIFDGHVKIDKVWL